MIRYETLMLARTEITNDELTAIERRFDELATQGGGTVVAFDKWGKYRLAYPVGKNAYGVYVLVRYNLNEGEKLSLTLQDVENFMRVKCHEIVMRHVTKRLEPNAPSVYSRPEPVDSARASNIDNIIKESKSLLDSVESADEDNDFGGDLDDMNEEN